MGVQSIKPLSHASFSPYGDVIMMSKEARQFPINQGYTQRFHDLADLDLLSNSGRPGVSLFRSSPLPTPLTLTVMERHPLSSQAFMPLSHQPYLVVVAPAGDFERNNIEIFLAQPGQGVNYHAGTWHHFCLALNEVCDFLVIDRLGDGPNCDEVELSPPLLIKQAEWREVPYE